MSKFTNLVGDVDAPFFVEWSILGALTMAGDTGPKKCYNVFDFRRLDNGNPFSPANIHAALWAAIDGPLLAATVDAYAPIKTATRALDDPSALEVETATVGNGTLEEDPYASDDAVYMQLRSGFRGRSLNGSKHFGGMSEESIDAGYLNAGGVTLWDAVRDVLTTWSTAGQADADGNTWFLCIVSRLNSNLESAPCIFTGADVATVGLNKRIGTMGRRRGARQEV